MPSSCSVPGCRSNYQNGGRKVSTFRFPKDELLRKKWIVGIRRKDFVVSKYSCVCELHFKESDIETESSAYDPKTGRTLTAPLGVKRLKKGVVPSLLPATSSSTKGTLSKENKRVEKELELTSQESLSSVSEENFHLKIIAEATSSSPALRLLENEEKEIKKTGVKRKGKSFAGPASSKKLNRVFSSDPEQQNHSNGVQGLTENKSVNERSQVLSTSPFHLTEIHIKEEPPWEVGYSALGDTSSNNPEESVADVQITHVRSISDDSNVEVPTSEEGNAIAHIKPEECFDSTFYTKPLNIDQRDKAFGSFVACEMSDLRENAELYMKTKQSILKILTEAHFEQMSSGDKLISNTVTNPKSSVVL